MAAGVIVPTPGAFSRTGDLDPALIEGTIKLNPKYAWLNRPIVAVRTAHILEMGQQAVLSLRLQNIPRIVDMIKIDQPLYANLHDRQRMCIQCDGKRDELEFCLREIGPNSHAIVFGHCRNNIDGHCWNYVYDHSAFITLDNYSDKKHRLGIEDSDRFWSKYKPSVTALIFGRMEPTLLDGPYTVVSS
jgi:hypothetical protein